MVCERLINSLKPDNPVHKLIRSCIIDTQYKEKEIYLKQIRLVHCKCFLVANTINFSLAIIILF